MKVDLLYTRLPLYIYHPVFFVWRIFLYLLMDGQNICSHKKKKTKLTGFILLNITFMFYRVLRVGSR